MLKDYAWILMQVGVTNDMEQFEKHLMNKALLVTTAVRCGRERVEQSSDESMVWIFAS